MGSAWQQVKQSPHSLDKSGLDIAATVGGRRHPGNGLVAGLHLLDGGDNPLPGFFQLPIAVQEGLFDIVFGLRFRRGAILLNHQNSRLNNVDVGHCRPRFGDLTITARRHIGDKPIRPGFRFRPGGRFRANQLDRRLSWVEAQKRIYPLISTCNILGWRKLRLPRSGN